MYKLIIFYECEQVTYIVSPHKEALEFMRDMIEEKYKKRLALNITLESL